jgi:multidrug transporter EmrE-like cation transporter
MAKHAMALVVALLLNAAANLMIKFGMRDLDAALAGGGLLDGGLPGLVRLLLRHWILLLGLFCFAANIVFYAFALQKLPISIAYPIMVACGFAIIVSVAGFLLKERLTVLQWVGVAAILFGVVLVARDAGRQMEVRPDGPASSTKAR